LKGDAPLPTAVRTGLAFLKDPAKARTTYEGSDFGGPPGEGSEACLARLYPDYAALSGQAGFDAATRLLYGDYQVWLADHVIVTALPDSADLAEGDDE
jgi:exodeoxyribonuclease V gamma subunit